MNITIDTSVSKPVCSQLVDQIREAVQTEELESGQQQRWPYSIVTQLSNTPYSIRE